MAITEKHKGISYVSDEGTLSRYTVFIEGRRVMDVFVDNATTVPAPGNLELPEEVTLHPISVGMVDVPPLFPGAVQATKGFAAKHPHLDNEGVSVHVDTQTVGTYVMPRLATLLARIFVPAA